MNLPRFFKKPYQADTLNKNLQRMLPLKTSQWNWLEDITYQMSLSDLRKAKNNPIIWKGINKKARDLVYEGFEIDNPLDGEDVPPDMEDKIKDFLTEHQVTRKIHQAVRDSLWSNKNGWIEWVTTGNKKPDEPLGGNLVGVEYVATGYISGYEFNKEKTGIEYWILSKPVTYKGVEYKKIHVSRLEPIGFYPEGDDPFSTSIIEIARQAIRADNDATVALADNLSMFGHPFPTINTTDNVNTQAVDDAYKALGQLKKKQLKIGFAGFKDTKFQLMNPNNPTPQWTLYHFYLELAAALEIPMMFLIGEQKGKLTGSEIELNDYYKHIQSIQNIYLSPVFHKMFKLLVGDAWRYEIRWNPLYVDEKSESEIKTRYMEKVGELYSKHGLIDVVEGRQLLRELGVDIPENNDLDDPEPDFEEPPGDEEDVVSPVTVRRLTAAEKELAKRQRELGEKEMIEQEKRLKKNRFTK